MRRAWGAVALLVLLLLLFLITQETGVGKASEKNETAALPSFGMRASEMASFGERNAAVLQLFLYPEKEGDVAVFCSDAPIQKNVLVLRHPPVPGIPSDMKARIEKSLARVGVSSREAGVEDALSSENSVIIAATGAVPASLLNASGSVAGKNSRVIVLETLDGKTIEESGRISNSNGTAAFEIVSMAPNGEGQAADEIARKALFPYKAGIVEYSAKGDFTLAIATDANGTYCRAVLLGNCTRFADSPLLLMPNGRLEGPKRVAAGKPAEFEFSLWGDSEVGRKLRFFAATYAEGEKTGSQEIAGGIIVPGWADRFALPFPKGGGNVVRITDQYGRLHASAYIDVLGLKVEKIYQSGSRRDFRLILGNEPLNGEVEVRIDEGQARKYIATNGTLIIYAAPEAGNRTLHFSSGGAQAKYTFFEEENGLFEAYFRYGLPALIFLLAIYFLLRAGRKVKYRITFPQFAKDCQDIVDVSCGELVDAWRKADLKFGGFCLAANPHEIADALAALKNEKGGIDSHSVLRALRQCVSSGSFSESEGTFAPSAHCREFWIGELRVMRLLHDIMLENGAKFSKGRRIPLGKGQEFFIFGAGKGVLGGIGKRKRIVVFESADALGEFESGLDAPDKENMRVKIALDNGKISFIPAERKEIEAVF